MAAYAVRVMARASSPRSGHAAVATLAAGDPLVGDAAPGAGGEPVRCVVDARGSLVDASDPMLAVLGYRRADVASLTLRRIVDPIHLATILEERRVPAGGADAVRRHRVLLVTRSGGRLWADLELRPSLRDGEPVTEALLRLDHRRPTGRPADLSRILDAMTRAQAQFIEADDPGLVFGGLLAEFVDLTDSTFGFIGEVLEGPGGAPFLRTHALTNIAWDDATRDLHGRTLADGMEFRDLATLFGACLDTKAPVIANEPATDARAGGVPQGHPPLLSFLGLPVVHGDAMVGMVGIANRPGGYDGSIVERLGPLLATTAGITVAYRERASRRAAERELRDRDEILRAIVDHAPEIIYLKDEAGRYLVFNPVGARMLGFDPDGIVGRSDVDLYRTDEAAEIRQADARVMETRSTLTYESTLVRDGRRRMYLNTKSPWTGDDGSVRGVIGITTDITDRVEAGGALEREGELLAQSESMLRGIIVSVGEGTITSDQAGTASHSAAITSAIDPAHCRMRSHSR